MNQDMDVKQLLLKEEIVDKGYDVEACQTYLISQKPEGGDDIENWSFEELKKAISEFQATQAKEETPAESIIETQPQEQQTVIECQKCSTNELTDGSMKVKILGYKKESDGFFKASYIAFQIETQPIGWVVSRRYSDFEWLRSSLVKLFPGFVVPPIHKKRLRTFEDAYLLKRQIFLERFLNALMNTYELRSNLVTKMFLSCQSQGDLRNFMESINKTNPISNPSYIRNKDGILPQPPTIEQLQYIQQTQELFSSQEGLFKKIRVLSKQLKTNQQNNAISVYNIGEAFASLFHINNKTNQILNQGQMPSLAQTYLNLNNMMITWGNIINNQITQTEEFFNSYFKFQQHSASAVKNFYTLRQNMSADLEKLNYRLNAKKEKLFEQGDVTKWELKQNNNNTYDLLKDKKLAFEFMCETETLQQKNQTLMLSYLTNQVYNETQQYAKLLQLDLSNHFIRFCQRQAMNISEVIQTIKQNHLLWADVLTNLQNNAKFAIKPAALIVEKA